MALSDCQLPLCDSVHARHASRQLAVLVASERFLVIVDLINIA
jgi:hypothetical protein